MILIFITIFTLILLASAAPENTIVNNKYNNTLIVIILFVMISISVFFIEINSVPDLDNYSRRFYAMDIPFKYLDLQLNNDPLFDFFQWLIMNTIGSFDVFLVLVWTVIFINLTTSLKNLFSQSNLLFVFVSYITYFIFFSYVLNVMRQGLAISFLILSISLSIKNKGKIKFYISLMAVPLLHSSALPLSLAILFLKWFNIKVRTILIIWFIAIVLFITNLNITIFSVLQLKQIETYTSIEALERYSAVNRLDFLLFSVLFGIIFYLIWKFVYKKENYRYEKLLSYYLIFNVYYLFLGFIAFSDRLAAYSWMLIPIILWKSIPRETKKYRLKSFILLSSFLILAIYTNSLKYILEPFM